MCTYWISVIIISTSDLLHIFLNVHIYLPTYYKMTYSLYVCVYVEGNKVIICSYDTLRHHIADFLSHPYPTTPSSPRVWAAVVLDEAHIVKNPKSKTAQAVFQLHAVFRVVATGTPIQNQLDELWSFVHFLMPDFLGNHNYMLYCTSSLSYTCYFILDFTRRLH